MISTALNRTGHILGAICLLAAAGTLHADSNIRVNAGGPAYTDKAGNAWGADTGFTSTGTSSTGTFSTTAAVANTPDPTLYQTERFGNAATLEYITPVTAPGQYQVILKFAEIWFTSRGQRVFNIVINGTTVESNFDPFVAAGGANIAVDRTYEVDVAGATIDIQLVPVTSNPKVSAIEIDLPHTPYFRDQEIPAGTLDGNNTSFALTHAPYPAASILLLRNGVALKQGVDFNLSGKTITFTSSSVPQPADTLQAFYRY